MTRIGDLAAYYPYLPRLPDNPPATEEAPRIVASGAPMRGIAPFGACHGDVDTKACAAWLGGQPAVYLRAQLLAFASGERRNDIVEQMRNVARQMTPEEIDAASDPMRTVDRPTELELRAAKGSSRRAPAYDTVSRC